MKRTAFLLIALMLLITCVPASAEVTVKDIQNAWAAANIESFHMNIQADLTVNMNMEGTTMQAPLTWNLNYAAKGDKALMAGSIFTLGQQFASVTYTIDGAQSTATIDVMGQTQTIAQTLPEPFDVGIGFTLPEDAVITPTAQGCAASIDYSRLFLNAFDDLDNKLPLSISGMAGCVYLFDSDLMPIGASITLDGFTLSMQGIQFTMDGTMTMSYTGFNDVTDDELATPAADTGSPAA